MLIFNVTINIAYMRRTDLTLNKMSLDLFQYPVNIIETPLLICE